MILKRGWQAVLVLTWLGCAGELENPDRFSFLDDDNDSGTLAPTHDASMPAPANPPACVATVLDAKCALAGCHSASAPQVNLTSAGVQARLVGKMSSEACEERLYITTDGSPSLLTQKLRDSPPCGSKMPIGLPLTTTETRCLTDWVESLSD